MVAEIAERLPAAVAVSFLFSYLDSRHEDALAEALAKRLPDVPVTVSSAVAREFREYPRTATAALNAGLRPVVGAYLAQLRSPGGPARRRRAAADHAVQRRVPARRAGRRRGTPAGALRPAPASRERWRWAPATACAGSCPSTWAAPRSMCAWSATACRRSPPLSRWGTTRSSARRLTSSRPGRAAAASPGSTGPAGCGSARRAPGIPWPGRVRAGRRPLHRHRCARGSGHAAAGRAAGRRPHPGPGAARRARGKTGGQLGLGAGDAADGIVQAAVAQIDRGRCAGCRSSAASTPAIHPGRVRWRGTAARRAAAAGSGPGRRAGAPLPGAVRRGWADLADLRIDESNTVLRVLEPALLPEARVVVPAHGSAPTGQLRRDGIQALPDRTLASADCRLGQGYAANIGVAPVTQRGLASLAARVPRPAPRPTATATRRSRRWRSASPGRDRRAAAPRACGEAPPRRRRRHRPGGCGRGCRGSGCRAPLYDRDALLAGNRVPGRGSSTSWTRPRWCWPASVPDRLPRQPVAGGGPLMARPGNQLDPITFELLSAAMHAAAVEMGGVQALEL